jgi:hypothetical protein
MVVSIWAQNGPVQAGKYQNGNGTCLTCTGTVALTTDEVADLIQMREEEKLARDVYLTLSEKWGVLVFDTIADSEQTHFEAIKILLDRYEVADPAIEGVGKFSTEGLTDLYKELTKQGSISLADAMYVGAKIEDMDIVDLKEVLATTKKVDLTNVYSNLLLGSMNHLRTFVSHLQVLGITYEPQYLTSTELAEILSATGPGKGRR